MRIKTMHNRRRRKLGLLNRKQRQFMKAIDFFVGLRMKHGTKVYDLMVGCDCGEPLTEEDLKREARNYGGNIVCYNCYVRLCEDAAADEQAERDVLGATLIEPLENGDDAIYGFTDLF